MSVSKIKITAAGWAGFTGEFCQTTFTNGVSDYALPRIITDRMAAIIECQFVDDTGAEAGQAGVTARLVSLTDVSVPVIEPLRVMTDAEQEAETQQAIAAALNAPANVSIYTAAQLEAIGSKEGIGGLRAIGDKWRVKGRSINQVIFEILRAQSEYKARSDEKANEQKLAREAASKEAIAAQAARDLAISASARDLSAEAAQKRADPKFWHRHEDGTPNAIDADGKSVFVAPPAPPVFVDPQLAETKAS